MTTQSVAQKQLAYVVKVVREAGYAPTDAEIRSGMVWLTFANPTDSRCSPRVAIADIRHEDILQTMRAYAGEANQPSAANPRHSTARYVTFLDRAACVCEFGRRPDERKDRIHIRPDDMCAIECGLPESVARKYENYRPGMIDTVIAGQVRAGGVDTEGSRAQAERWLAMVCTRVCAGLRATTVRSRFHDTHSDVLGWEDHLDMKNPSPRLGVP